VKKSRDIESLILADLFDELEPEDKIDLDSALSDDSDRQRELDQLRSTMSMVRKAALRKDPGKDFWKNVWPKFQNRLMAAEKRESWWKFKITSPAWSDFWRPALQIGFVAAMLIVGIFIGKQISGAGDNNNVNNLEPYNDVAYPYEKEIDQKKSEYLLNVADSSIRRSRELISDFMSIRPEQAGQDVTLISNNRQEMFRLLDEINTLRNSFSDPQIQYYSSIFDEIEIVIGEIATIEGDPNSVQFEIRIIQEGISNRELLDRLGRIHITTTINGKQR
jgi:hypothetical protein